MPCEERKKKARNKRERKSDGRAGRPRQKGMKPTQLTGGCATLIAAVVVERAPSMQIQMADPEMLPKAPAHRQGRRQRNLKS